LKVILLRLKAIFQNIKNQQHMSNFSYSILSIDGGGIRGIIPGIVLAEIERRTGMPTAEAFDLIAGTSTGGILATGLAIPDENGKPLFNAEELVELYTGPSGKKIFKKPLPGFLNYLRGAFTSLFPQKNLRKALHEKFKDARLKDALTPLLITAYNTQEKKPFYFKSYLAKEEQPEDFAMWEVALATAAAPVYFPPHKMKYGGQLGDRTIEDVSLVDGGVFASNPAALAYVEAIRMWKDTHDYKRQFAAQAFVHEKGDDGDGDKGMMARVKADNFAPPIFMVSIGTGRKGKTYKYKKVKRWGIPGWILPLIDILMQGSSETVDYQMQYLLPPFIGDNGVEQARYYRFNITIDPEYADMSDASPKNVKQLIKYGHMLVAKMSEVPKLTDEELKRRGGVPPKAPLDEIIDILKLISNKRKLRGFENA
jgi:hypothetical protein